MGESNGNRQAGQNQSLQKTGNERNDKKIKEISEILSAYDFMTKEGLSEIEFESERIKFRIKRKVETPVFFKKHFQKEEKEEEIFNNAVSIKSPLSGTFYASPKHGSPPFVSINDIVEEKQTLCIIEAMKVMNEIKSDSKYKIIKILAANGKSVSAGEVLFLVKPV